jgi:hypothetical protein
MKTKTIILILLSVLTVARADFINLNPGGYDYAAHQFQPPASLFELINEQTHNHIALFDSASPGHWNGFGVLPGGTYFFTDLITNGAEPFATVNWNFSALPGFQMRFLDVVGTLNGDPWETVWLATGHTVFDSNGDLLVTLNGDIDITSIAFYGRTPNTTLPDSGSTVALMGLGLTVLFLIKRRHA